MMDVEGKNFKMGVDDQQEEGDKYPTSSLK
jgi:hypothetical protein